MAAQPSVDDNFTFVGGLNTEGGFFITPKNSWKEGDNITPFTDGSIQRRKALDYEDDYVLYDPDTGGGAPGPGGGGGGEGPGGIGGDGFVSSIEGTGFTLSMPANILPGDVLMAVVSHWGIADVVFSGVNADWPTSIIYPAQDNNGGTRTHFFFRTVDGDEFDPTFTISGVVIPESVLWTVVALRGVDDPRYPNDFQGNFFDYAFNLEAGGNYNSGSTDKEFSTNQITFSLAFGMSAAVSPLRPTTVPTGMTSISNHIGDSYFDGSNNVQIVQALAYDVFNGDTYNPDQWGDNGASGYSVGVLSLTIGYDPLASSEYVPEEGAITGLLGAYSVSPWTSINGNGSLELLVAQVGPTIYFYPPNAGSVSAGKKAFSINLVDYQAFGNTSIIGTNVITCANCYGKLLITSADTNPILVVYDEATDDITVTEKQLHIRDFSGLRSPVPPQTEYTEAQWTALTPSFWPHALYNLYNQGWKDTQIDAYKSAHGGLLPSNTKQWIYGKDTNDSFDVNVLDKQDFGTSLAPKGRFILNAFYQDRAAVLSTVDDTTPQTSTIPSIPNINDLLRGWVYE